MKLEREKENAPKQVQLHTVTQTRAFLFINLDLLMWNEVTD